MHEPSRKLFLPPTPRRDGHSPSHRRPASQRVQQRDGMAREPPSPLERRSLEPDNRRRLGSPQVGDVGWLLASEGGMTDHIVARLTTKRAELARLATELERDLDQCR